MATSPVKFYLDENLSPKIIEQLRMQGIDIIRGPLSARDPQHLQNATGMGRVVCTEDRDFLRLAAAGLKHAGVIKGKNTIHGIGDWVMFLSFVHATSGPEELRDTVLHIFSLD